MKPTFTSTKKGLPFKIRQWYLTAFLLMYATFANAQAPNCNALFLQFPNNANPDSIHFFYLGFPMTSYSWNFGDGGTATTAAPWHYFATPGTYNVCLIVFDSTAGGTCTDTNCVTVNISGTGINCNPNFLHFAVGNNQENVNFFYIGSAATSYSWNFGDGTTATTQNPAHLYTAPGTYYVCVGITDSTAAGTCTGTFCDSVIVTNPPPTCNPRYFQFPANGNPDSIRFFYFGTQATSFAWDFGDGSTSTLQNPNHNYASTGIYIACVTVTDSTSGGTCTGTFCDTVRIVTPPPICNAHFVHNVINGTDSIRFNYNGNAAATYLWDFGDSTSSTLQNPHHLFPRTGNYTVCVTITNTNSGGTCTDTYCTTFHVTIRPPVCNAHFNRNSFNDPDSIQFTYNGTTATTYAWDFGDGTTSTLKNPLHVFAQGGQYHICVTITTTNGAGTCTDTYCRNSNIPITPPTCNAQFGHYTTSNLDSIAFVYNGGIAATYSWNFGDGTNSNVQNPSHVYSTFGNYLACVTITNTNNGGTCSSTFCDSVKVLAAIPVCDAHFQHVSAIDPDSLQFFPLSTSALTYLWDFGDGSTATTTTPWHQFAGGGLYNVCLTITDSTAGGTCTNTICDTVNIPYPAPICDGQFTYVSIINPEDISFSPLNIIASTYAWDFGDGDISTVISPTHIYASSGIYIVCLTVTNTTLGGSCSNTWCDTLNIVIPPPTCDATFGYFAQFNNPDSIHVNAIITTAQTYTWDFGDGTTITSQADEWHFYSLPGDYIVCLTVTDSSAGGTCTNTWCDTINIPFPVPVCAAQFAQFNINNSDSIQFFYSGSTALTYAWDFGDGGTSTIADPIHKFIITVPTTFYVCVTITDSTAGGTCSSTWCDSVHASVLAPICDPSFSHFTGSNIDSVYFFPSNTNLQTYTWDFGDGSTSTQQTNWHKYTAIGTYTVCLTVTDTNGGGSCSQLFCDTVQINGITGINTISSENGSIKIYPNPMNESATIELNSTIEKAIFTMYDLDGRVVYKNENLSSGKSQIETREIANGMYFYSLTSQSKILANGKLLITH